MQAGFIERIRNPTDERQVLVELAECGKSLDVARQARDNNPCLFKATISNCHLNLILRSMHPMFGVS